MDIPTSDNAASIPSWNVQYLKQGDMNSISVNKDTYIMYRVTDTWLCLFVKASEFVRETHVVVNNMTNCVPNQDTVITCENNICGFDIKYITTENDETLETWIPHDHILPIHSNVRDQDPYVNYIMDNPQTIRFMYQLSGNRYFIPKLNSRFEIVIYTCHGEAANFTGFKQDEQPSIVTESNRYPNNGNVMKTAFVLSASSGGTNISNMEMVRRQTIEAYNTANIISTDNDIKEWFKTFFFKNILYPFFYKRRDDPWGRVWAGFIALKDDDNVVFRTNTLHASIPYRVLYNNNDNTVTDNEIIIPPGWLWIYSKDNRYTVRPYIRTNNTVETAKTMSNIPDKFVFANPFGIRIQKQPFSIGYFNPWVNSYTTTTHDVDTMHVNTEHQTGDLSIIYHATPLFVGIQRTYENDYYTITTYINPTLTKWIDDTPLAKYVRYNAVAPKFVSDIWNYFREPLDLYAPNIPMCRLSSDGTYIPFDPDKTYLCVKSKNISADGSTWTLNNLWIEDYTNDSEPKTVVMSITGYIDKIYGLDSVWGDSNIVEGISYGDDTIITLSPAIQSNDPITFTHVSNQQYYEMRLRDSNVEVGDITKIVVSSAYKTELTKHNETNLYRIGNKYSPVYINVYFKNNDTERVVQYLIQNAAEVLIPYTPTLNDNEEYVFELDQVGPNGIVLYADMKPSKSAGAYDYYRIKLSKIDNNIPMFYIANKILPVTQNNMRVVLHAFREGNEVGWVEMQPVFLEADGSYKFDVKMYSLDKLVDVNNSIRIATTTDGGGSWIPTVPNSPIYVSAENPEFMISIFIRTPDIEFNPGINVDESFKGFRVVDQYKLDDISLVQELKEMRSVVNWGESSEPTENQIYAYDNIMELSDYNPNGLTFYDIKKYVYNKMHENETDITFLELKNVCGNMVTQIMYLLAPSITPKPELQFIIDFCSNIRSSQSISDDVVEIYNEMKEIDDGTWEDVYEIFNEENYAHAVNETFSRYNVNGGLEIQLSPFVSSDLMVSNRFSKFVTAFTTVHKSIEPVIFNRLEGNNYLDCKLIATYGLPHSYTSDVDKNIENSYWPDLDVQIEFDVKLYNNAIASNTLNELKIVIRDYFNRLTSIHTPVDIISMDNNIYISNLIDQMKDNENVAYLKFKGWYTNDKGHGGKYMNADYQAIVQKWDKIDDMPTDELTRFVPEMFVLDDSNILLNIV